MSTNPPDPRANMTIHDVFRFLVRRVGGHDDAQTYDLLSMVDADEQGHQDLASYREAKAKQDAQAVSDAQTPAQRAAVAASQSGALSDADLEAELARRRAAAGSTSPDPAPVIAGPPSTP